MLDAPGAGAEDKWKRHKKQLAVSPLSPPPGCGTFKTKIHIPPDIVPVSPPEKRGIYKIHNIFTAGPAFLLPFPRDNCIMTNRSRTAEYGDAQSVDTGTNPSTLQHLR